MAFLTKPTLSDRKGMVFAYAVLTNPATGTSDASPLLVERGRFR